MPLRNERQSDSGQVNPRKVNGMKAFHSHGDQHFGGCNTLDCQ